MKLDIRMVYLYLVAFAGLLITVFGTIRLVNNALTTYIFPEADRGYYAPVMVTDPEGKPIDEEYQLEAQRAQEQAERSQKQREMAGSLASILVGVPLYVYHWRTIQQERKSRS